MKKVGDVMSTDLLTISPQTTVAEAATMMGARQVGAALVTDAEGRLTGIFTERDIVKALAAHFDAAGHPVDQWMTKEPSSVSSDQTENDALDLMLAGGFRHLPVVDDGRLVGIISIRDVSHHAGD
jgi:CBS domain-containing protein